MSAVGDARKRLDPDHVRHPDPAVAELLEAAEARGREQGRAEVVAAVEALHRPDTSGEHCDHCWVGQIRGFMPPMGTAAEDSWWPCPTIRALRAALAQDPR